jgi:hypothetical protein
MFDGVRRQLRDQSQGGQFRPVSEMDDSDAANEFRQLLDLLLATRRDLSEGLLPRAARIKGKSEQIAQVISRLETAIRTTESLLARHGCPATSGCRASRISAPRACGEP